MRPNDEFFNTLRKRKYTNPTILVIRTVLSAHSVDFKHAYLTPMTELTSFAHTQNIDIDCYISAYGTMT